MKTHTDTKPVADVLRDAAVIVTYTDEQGRHDEVRTAALDAARRAGAQLILYPLELYSPLSNPLPTEWSAEGDRASYGDPLSVEDLELLGQEWLAAQVLDATRSGVDAGAGLPESRGVGAMVEYAREHRAAAVLLPREALADAGPLERLLGRDTKDAVEAERKEHVAVLLVDPSGAISHSSQEEAAR